jgi:dihydrofolate reductase
MKSVIIAAKSDNDVIGKGNDLVWDLPADQAFFLRQIEGCFLLTGRISYESPQGTDLFHDGRDIIVVTRQEDYETDGALVAHSIEEAFERAAAAGAEQLCILGGAAIYRQTIDRVDELVITEVHAEFEGDVFFPLVDPAVWRETFREDHCKDRYNPYDYSFVFYERRGGD